MDKGMQALQREGLDLSPLLAPMRNDTKPRAVWPAGIPTQPLVLEGERQASPFDPNWKQIKLPLGNSLVDVEYLYDREDDRLDINRVLINGVWNEPDNVVPVRVLNLWAAMARQAAGG